MNVSTHLRGPEQSGEVLRAHVVGITGGTSTLGGLEFVADKHTMQIASLTSQIEVKNEEISKFNEDLKDIRRQNNDLKITVESKDDEIEGLKEQIKKLESERKVLQTALRDVKGELDATRKEVVALKGQNSTLKGKIEHLEDEKEALERNLKSVEGQLNDVRQEVIELKNENSSIRKRNAAVELDVKKLSNRVDELTRDNSKLRKEVRNRREAGLDGMASFKPSLFLPDPVEKASLLLGELCRQIQAMMYKKVLPNSPYDDKKSYKVKYMLEDMDELEDETEKAEAGERWEALQKTLQWKKRKHTRAMKSIQDKRNDTAHPALDEKQLVDSVELMKQKEKLPGYCPPECANELINMWKILSQ